MDRITKKFLQRLGEDASDIDVSTDMSPDAAVQGVMDSPSSAAGLDVRPAPDVAYRNKLKAQQQQTLAVWIQKIMDTVEYLNGLGAESMQATLNQAECDTLFADVARTESKKIARIAQELSGLEQSLKGYLLREEN